MLAVEDGDGKDRGRGLRDRSMKCKINIVQGHIVQHREHSRQYFITALKRMYFLKTVNHYAVYLKLSHFTSTTLLLFRH